MFANLLNDNVENRLTWIRPANWQLSIVAVFLPHLVNDGPHTSRVEARFQELE